LFYNIIFKALVDEPTDLSKSEPSSRATDIDNKETNEHKKSHVNYSPALDPHPIS